MSGILKGGENRMNPEIQIGNSKIGLDHPTYFIADIASNHGGDLEIAKTLIIEAAAAGANAAKFQHFRAETLVSSVGFEALGEKIAHQKVWNESAFQVYKNVEVPFSWTKELQITANQVGIDFFTAPYDLQFIDDVEEMVSAYKIGSGDITWLESIGKMAKKLKPILLATGASTLEDVERAVACIESYNNAIVIMQCNTNYSGERENINYINLNVLAEYKDRFPNRILGLSDHTPGHLVVLGAVALGARVIEKHFASNSSPANPDLHFSLTPKEWRRMVDETRELESSLGDGNKKIEKNEIESVIAQRRSLRYSRNLPVGHVILEEDLISLRPAPIGSLPPYFSREALGKILHSRVEYQQVVNLQDFTTEKP